ncbi:unnamed protein product [Rhodiola kirilowii]
MGGGSNSLKPDSKLEQIIHDTRTLLMGGKRAGSLE